MSDLEKENARLVELLKEAVAILKPWHELGAICKSSDAEAAWSHYWFNDPNIKPIREFLEAHTDPVKEYAGRL